MLNKKEHFLSFLFILTIIVISGWLGNTIFRHIWSKIFIAPYTPQKEKKIPQTIEELQTCIANVLKKYKISGAGIAIVSKDSIIWTGGVGVTGIGKPVTKHTHFRMGSISKGFLSLGFLKLRDEGKMDLNAPIKQFIPEIKFINPWDMTHPIRVAHLLEHSAGIENMRGKEFLNYHDDLSLPTLQALAISPQSRKVRWPPGTRMSYSNHGYAVAGYILEKVVKKNYEDYLQEQILKPLGMKTSTFNVHETKKLLIADHGTNKPFYPLYLRAAGSLTSTPAEMALFVQFMLNKGKVGKQQIISRTAIKRMEISKTTIAGNTELDAKYGLGNAVEFKEEVVTHGHYGVFDGFLADYRYIENIDCGYTVMLYRASSMQALLEISSLTTRYLTAGNKEKPVAKIILSLQEKQKFTGYYEVKNAESPMWEFAYSLFGGIEVFIEDDILYQKTFVGKKEALIPVAKAIFRKVDEPLSSTAFTTSEDGIPVLITPGHGYIRYYEKGTAWKASLHRSSVLGAFIIMGSSLLYAVFWLPLCLYRRRKNNPLPYLRMTVVPWLAALFFLCTALFYLGKIFFSWQGTIINILFIFFVGMFTLLSFLSMYFAIKGQQNVRAISKAYALILSISCCWIALYFTYWSWYGLRPWQY